MEFGVKGKDLKKLLKGERNIKDLQPKQEKAILLIWAAIEIAENITELANAIPGRRVHHWTPKKDDSYWSIDVEGDTRLLFYYDKKERTISGMIFSEHYP